MNYNLTDRQKDLLRWIVDQVRSDRLEEEFHITFLNGGTVVSEWRHEGQPQPDVTLSMLEALCAEQCLRCTQQHTPQRIGSRSQTVECSLTGIGYQAVDSDFNEPDTTFLRQLTPLSDISLLDERLKERCLPVLATGANDPKNWDTAVRNAGVVLEERLRVVGGITDPHIVSKQLANAVFGQNGSKARSLKVDSEREGYRDLYAGVMGAFRNPFAHRWNDPTPEDGGAILVFINLLLKMLDDLP